MKMNNGEQELVFAVSILACCLPFAFVILSFFETAEPYHFLVLISSLMEGSFLGSILGMISLFCNRKIKNIKINILSLFSVFMLFLSIVLDCIYSCNKP